MIQGTEKYKGMKLNKLGLEDYKDIIDGYGFIEEHCSDSSGVKISFDRRGYRIKDIQGIKYTSAGYQFTDKLPKIALKHLDDFITYITEEKSK